MTIILDLIAIYILSQKPDGQNLGSIDNNLTTQGYYNYSIIPTSITSTTDKTETFPTTQSPTSITPRNPSPGKNASCHSNRIING